MRTSLRDNAHAVWLLIFLTATAIAAEPTQWSSQSGSYKVSYRSSITPVEINRIHEWVLHVETDDGLAVEGAEIMIVGGMREHDHGLPTMPRVTAYLGDGNYRVQGVRFHMAGEWQIVVTIKVDGRVDSVEIELEL